MNKLLLALLIGTLLGGCGGGNDLSDGMPPVKNAKPTIIPADKPRQAVVQNVEYFELADGRRIEISETAMKKLTLAELKELLEYENWSEAELDMIGKLIQEKKSVPAEQQK